MERCHRRYVADRFIPVRSAMDFGISSCLLRDTKWDPEKEAVRAASPAAEAYRMLLAETLTINRRILTFWSKPSADDSAVALKPSKRRRYIPQSPDDLLEAPGIVDDYCLNLLDWGSGNVIAIALGDTVFLWDASNRTTWELVTVDEGDVITSLSWAPDGRHIAVGCNSSLVHIWDAGADRHLRTLRCGHRFAVGSLAWNNSILATGGLDGLIVNNDMRIKSRAVKRYQGHQQEVCTLKWSGSGQLLASGGCDNLLYIWDQASASSSVRWLHKIEDHRAAVRALAWCPFQNNVLASGGGDGDHSIKFWDTCTGARLSSIDTGSQVCSLLWSKKEREFLSSHGFTKNQLTLWEYPSMVKMAELTGHTSRVLFMAQSPDGCTVASAAGDETIRLWNVFGTPEIAKPKVPMTSFTSYCGFLVVETRSLECFYVIYTYSYCGYFPCCRVYILNSDAATNVSYTCVELQYISAMFIPSVICQLRWH